MLADLAAPTASSHPGSQFMRLPRLALPALVLASAACSDVPPIVAPVAPASPPALTLAATAGVDLGSLAPEGLASANDVDAAGRAVRYTYTPASRAVVFANGAVTPLPGLTREGDGAANGVSPNGRWIVGSVYDPSITSWRPARWLDGGAPALLNVGAASLPGEAQDVNDAGQVVGTLPDARGDFRAVRWELDGSITELGSLGGTTSFGYGINAHGDVVGFATDPIGVQRAFRWTAARGMVPLGSLSIGSPGVEVPVATDVNDAGVVVGFIYHFVNDVWQRNPAMWNAAGFASLVGALSDDPGAAAAINRHGVVVGTAQPRAGGAVYPWVWRPGEPRLTPLVRPPELTGFSVATGINDAGVIVGNGCCDPSIRALSWSLFAPNAAPVIRTLKLSLPVLNRPRVGQSLPVSFVWSDADGAAGPWKWTVAWGDGSTSAGETTTQTEIAASHVYATPGSRTARFTITDPAGASATRTFAVDVQP